MCATSSTENKAAHKGRQEHFEFFGPHIPALLVCALPCVVYGLVYTCNSHGCLSVFPPSIPGFPPGSKLFDLKALIVYVAWVALVLLLHLLLPGQRAQGVLLPNGQRLTYKLNAFKILVLLYGGAAALAFCTPYLPLHYVYDAYLPLVTAAILFSSTLAVYLYASSFKSGAYLSVEGSRGYLAYDFWMGRELNPRIGGSSSSNVNDNGSSSNGTVAGYSLDLKEFCELYPGMIGWAVINLAMAQKQYLQLGRVTNALLLTNAFQLYYVVDGLYNERSILTTMDITTDGFGFMLAFGDLAWVPFVFSTASRFLVDHPQDLSPLAVAGVLAVKALGYWIFRGANGQKDKFRSDPNHPAVRHLKTLKTERGTQLIVSGWWGMARHINYLGDWIMGLSWCLPTGLAGLQSIVPFFYCIYFGILLLHRERRDDESCRKKYGKDWDKYCKLVPYRIIPYVY